jgi:hypothetical protein
VFGELRIGEELRVSGNSPALGNNDRDRAIPMFSCPHDYPWWRTKEGSFGLLYFFTLSTYKLTFLKLNSLNNKLIII